MSAMLSRVWGNTFFESLITSLKRGVAAIPDDSLRVLKECSDSILENVKIVCGRFDYQHRTNTAEKRNAFEMFERLKLAIALRCMK